MTSVVVNEFRVSAAGLPADGRSTSDNYVASRVLGWFSSLGRNVMKTGFRAVFLGLVVLLALPAIATAQINVPDNLNVQGVLRNAAGDTVSGEYSIRFRLYSAEPGVTPVDCDPPCFFQVVKPTVQVVGGVFNVYLTVPDNYFKDPANKDALLEIKVGLDDALPRRPLSSVGFAMMADHSHTCQVLLSAAPDLACVDEVTGLPTACVDSSEVEFCYALASGDVNLTGDTCKGAAAANLICTDPLTGLDVPCVGGTDIEDDAVDDQHLASDLTLTGTTTVTGQIESTVADGTAPATVLSTTVVTNLNADLLDGQHGAYYLDPNNLSSTVPASKLPVASTTTLGVMQVGTGLTVADPVGAPGVVSNTGVLSVDVDVANTPLNLSQGGQNVIISMDTATAGQDGFITKEDWGLFYSRLDKVYLDPTIPAPPFTGVGTVGDPLGMTQAGPNGPAGGDQNGWLHADDWNTFNNKLDGTDGDLNYIQNQAALAQPASYWISGSGKTNGTMTAASFLATDSTYYVDPDDATTSAKLLGKVGIGTSSPKTGYLLDVDGKAWVEGGIEIGLGFGNPASNPPDPLKIHSTDLIENLNADLLDNKHAADFADASGDADYVQNRPVTGNVLDAQSSASFYVDGSGKVINDMHAGSFCLAGDCKAGWDEITGPWTVFDGPQGGETSIHTNALAPDRVGIGTGTGIDTDARLEVAGNIKATGASSDVFVGALGTSGEWLSDWLDQSVRSDATPQFHQVVLDSAAVATDAKITVGEPGDMWSESDATLGLLVGHSTDNVYFGLIDKGVDQAHGAIVFGDNPDDPFSIYFDDGPNPADRHELVTIEPGGNVGIGNNNPAEKLEVTGNFKATGDVGGDRLCIGGVCKDDWTITGLWRATGQTLHPDSPATYKVAIGGDTTSLYPLTIKNMAGSNRVIAIDNLAELAAKNSAGAYETYLVPRTAGNATDLTYGTGGFNVKDQAGNATMVMTDGAGPANLVGIGKTPANGYTLDVDGSVRAGGNLQVTGTQIAIEGGLGGDTVLAEGSGDALKVTTAGGWVELGAQSASAAHIHTDRAKFSMNKGLDVTGNVDVSGFVDAAGGVTVNGADLVQGSGGAIVNKVANRYIVSVSPSYNGDITSVNAGTGLSGGGTSGDVTLTANTNYLQRRVTDTCPAGSSIRIIDATGGNVTCETDTDTTYAPGLGLTLAGTTFNADKNWLQRRVAATCPAGSSIRVIDVDGGVSCESDDGEGIGMVAGNGNSGYVARWSGASTIENSGIYETGGDTILGPSGTTNAHGARLLVKRHATNNPVNLILEDNWATGDFLAFDVDSGSGLANIVANAYKPSTGATYRYGATGNASRINLEEGALNLSVGTGGNQNGTVTWQDKLQVTTTGVGVNKAPASALDVGGTVRASGYADQAGGDLITAGTGITVNDSGTGSYEIVADYSSGVVTKVTGGVGLSNTPASGTGNVTLNVDTGTIQRRVSGTCPAGQSIRVISDTGAVTCEVDDNAGGDITAVTVTGGSGLLGGGTSGSVNINTDPNVLQKRIQNGGGSGGCASGYYLQAVSNTGVPTCAADLHEGGDITGVVAGSGLLGGGTSGTVTLNVNWADVESTSHTHALTDGRITGILPLAKGGTGIGSACTNGQVLKSNGSAWTCGSDNNTNPNADIEGVVATGPYLNGGGTSGTVTITADISSTDGDGGLQARVASTCPAGSSIRVIAENGTVTCEVDNDTGDITAVTAGTGLTGGGTSGAVTLGLNNTVWDGSKFDGRFVNVGGDTMTGNLYGPNAYFDRFYDRGATSFYIEPGNTTQSANFAGRIDAGVYYDENNNSYYLDPASTSLLNDVRASIFYDRNNTAYYLNPAAGATGVSANLQGYVDATRYRDENNTGYYGDFASTSRFNRADLNDTRSDIFYDRNNTGFYMNPADTGLSANFAGPVDASAFRDENDNNFIVDPNGTSYLNDVRGSVFYDRDDTNYYANPASTSQFNDMRAHIFYDRNDTNYYADPNSISRSNDNRNNVVRASSFCLGSPDSSDCRTSWTAAGDNLGNHTATTTLNMNSQQISNLRRLSMTGTSDYDKLRVWSSGSYTIGMKSGQSFGHLNDYAMTFTMNNDLDRGFLWRDESDSTADGAMSLTTDGRLTVKDRVDAPRYYDRNDTNYYADPASTSMFNDMRANIYYDLGDTNYYANPAGTSNFNDFRPNIIYDRNDSSYVWDGSGTTRENVHYNYGTFYMGSSSGDTDDMYIADRIYDWDNTGYYLDIGSVSRMDNVQANRVYGFSDIRSPIFYDYNNTGYYGDFASTSRFNESRSNTHRTTTLCLGAWNGGTCRTSWPADGDITGVNAGTGLTGGGSSGTVTLSLDSGHNSGSSFDSRFVNVPGDTMTGDLIFSNYGIGITGVYSSSRYQNVFSMGAAYNLPANGTSTGNLYGIAWTYPNAGAEAIGHLSHQMIVVANGDTKSAMGNGVWTKYRMDSPIYYDQNNTGYYVDPSAHSNMGSGIRATDIYARSWLRNDGAMTGLYNQATANHFYSADDNYWDMDSQYGMRLRRGYNGTITGYLYADGTSTGILSKDGNWKVRGHNGGGELYNIFYANDFRPYIIYDRNNTGCYLDPNGTSVTRYFTATYLNGTHVRASGNMDVKGDLRYGKSHGGHTMPFVNGGSHLGCWPGYGCGNYHRAWARMFAYGVSDVSGEQFKRDIRDLDDSDLSNALSDLRKVRSVRYYYKHEVTSEEADHVSLDEPFMYQLDNGRTFETTRSPRHTLHMGVIAESLPDYATDPTKSTVSLGDMDGLIVASVKELDRQVQKLKEENFSLEDRLAILEQILVDAGMYQ